MSATTPLFPTPVQAAEAGGIPSWLTVEPRVRALWWAARKEFGLKAFPCLNQEIDTWRSVA